MRRANAIFTAACMALICASFGAVLYLTFGVPLVGALVSAIAALTGMALCNIAAAASGGRGASAEQVVDVSRGVAELARQVAELGRRVAAAENKMAEAAGRAEAVAAPLTAEIAEIGVLIKELAESVSAHDAALQDSRVFAAPETGAPAPPVHRKVPDEAAAPAAPAAPDQAPRPPVRRGDGIWPPPADGEAGVESALPERSGDLGTDKMTEAVRAAVDANRFEFYLQPILTLPQRKVRYYEALPRLRAGNGDLLGAEDYLAAAESAGLMPRMDNLVLFRCVQVVRRLLSKNRDVGLFCNVSAATLVDAEFFRQFSEFMDANRTVASALVLQFTQSACRGFGPIENEILAALIGWGFRFSMDRVSDLKIEPRDLAERGFRFLKVPAALLLDRHGEGAGDIHAADLSGLVSRFGIELIADAIESEGTVIDLLDYDVKYGQGYLFSPPRPVRGEILQPSPQRLDRPLGAARPEEQRRMAKDAERANAADASAAVRAAAESRADALLHSALVTSISNIVAASTADRQSQIGDGQHLMADGKGLPSR